MAVIQSMGLGSGLDVSGLIEGLVSSSRDPVENRINLQTEEINAKLSLYGTIRGTVSEFEDAVEGLNRNSLYNSFTTTSSDDTAVTATASSVAEPGSYQVEVQRLAQSHSLATASSYEKTNTILGSGTLSITLGTTDYDEGTDTYNSFTAGENQVTHNIDIDSSNNTLSGIRDAINNADIGIQASIVNDGTGFRLLLSSESTGEENSMQISVTESSPAGLSALAFDGTATNMTQTVEAQDSLATVNGLDVTRSDNLVAGVINGVTLNLKKASVGDIINVGIERDATDAATKMQEFVDSFNNVKTAINEVTKYVPDGDSGLLIGDSALRTLMNNIRSAVYQIVPGLENDEFRTLADIGISTNEENGFLSLNSSTFQNAIKENGTNVRNLIATNGRSTDSQVLYLSNTVNTQAGTYDVNIRQLASQGSFRGDTLNNLTIDANNDTFSINVDGTSSGTITLTQATYATGEDLAQEIQNQINADEDLSDNNKTVTVEYNTTSNRLEFSSSTFGVLSSVSFSGLDSNTAADLGIHEGSGSYISGALESLEVDSNNQTFTINVDGTDSGDITLNLGTYADGDALATELQTQINADTTLSSGGLGVTVSYNATDNNFEIISNNTGSGTGISITSATVTGVSELGLVVKSANRGNNTAGTINGQEATGSGQFLTGTDSSSDGLKLKIIGGSTGDRGTATFFRGVSDQLDTILSDILASDGLFSNKTSALQAQITDYNEQLTALDLRMSQLETRLMKQFTAMDIIVGRFNNTGSFLESQLKNLPYANLNKG
ncbi:MAG: hypothetical protein CMF25_06975 [Kangiellaceae bacterium]|nr:hypothetical protein [Kangiellaceae bacterium]|tara:strand:+ start:4646 stop:6991 length:2346 start_codon:yes stop_codon:yes gene_type:complete